MSASERTSRSLSTRRRSPTGSIAWCQSLPVDDYNNNVARITHNVLRAFLADEIPNEGSRS